MNNVTIVGKIKRMTLFDKVVYITVCASRRGEYEYIPVTVFQVDFFKRNFYEGKWIAIEGHVHINQQNGKYITEIIADNISFCGELTETDEYIKQLNALTTNEPENGQNSFQGA